MCVSNYKKICIVLVTAVFLTIGFVPTVQSQQTSDEIQQEIDEQREKLNQTESEISRLEQEIAQSQNNLNSASEGLPKLMAEIETIEKQIALNDQKLKRLEEENKLKVAQQKQLKREQDESLDMSYKVWRLQKSNRNSPFDDTSDYARFEFYDTKLYGVGSYTIEQLGKEILKLEKQIKDSSDVLSSLNNQNAELSRRRTEIEAEINYYNSIIAQNQGSVNGLKDSRAALENTIANLLAEQQEAARRESEILNGGGGVVTPPPPSSGDNGGNGGDTNPGNTTNFVFSGRGRDLYQGHGVGMSQWGAYGAALAGMNASQILNFYYTNTRVEARPGSINVQGYGIMDSNTYVAGLGEVPSKACGNAEQASARPDKYVVDNPGTVWDCWPEETIKAQVIAARSYALRYSGAICTTAACQVYTGGRDKQWAADETKDLVVVSNSGTDANQIINALYSADNNQGAGTANNDTIFQNFGGDGWAYSYLRAVNDTTFAATTNWTYWNYQTQQYNMGHILDMLNFIAYNPASTEIASTKTQVQALLNGVTAIHNIEFERDPSGRVKKVWLTIQDGSQRSIGGWWFKNIWNGWTYDIGRYDYIYSQTFYMN